MENTRGICSGCHKENDLITFRKGVFKCAECSCDQAGRSIMILFRKCIADIQPPVHVLVALSGGPSSSLIWHLLSTRINTNNSGKAAVIKRVEAITDKNIEGERINHIEQFSIKNAAQYAKDNDFNVLVLGDNIDYIAIESLGFLSLGRPDLLPWISGDESKLFSPILISRPARQVLRTEAQFFCDHKQIQYEPLPSLPQSFFPLEESMLNHVVDEGHGATPFAIQKLCERLPIEERTQKCEICGFPIINSECEYCQYFSSLHLNSEQ